jgi:ArsR family transcriptional regulator
MAPLRDRSCRTGARLEDERLDPTLEKVSGSGKTLRAGTDDNNRKIRHGKAPRIENGQYIDCARYIDRCQCDWQTGPMTTSAALLIQPAGACCAPTGEDALDASTAEDVAKVFKALGDPTRVRLLSLIAASPTGEACICDLTAPVGLSQPTVSHHMKQLVDAGLATREQRGKWAYYRADFAALTASSRALNPA